MRLIKRFRALLIGGAVAVTLLQVAPAAGIAVAAEADSASPAAAAVDTCDNGNVCVWSEHNYNGVRQEFRCEQGVHKPSSIAIGSVKNRCPDRFNYVINPGSICMNPGTNLAEVAYYEEISVGNQGGRC